MSVSEGFDDLALLMAARFNWIFYKETIEYNFANFTGSQLRVWNDNAREHYGIAEDDAARFVKATTPNS